mgnify:CR=1 FL=1
MVGHDEGGTNVFTHLPPGPGAHGGKDLFDRECGSAGQMTVFLGGDPADIDSSLPFVRCYTTTQLPMWITHPTRTSR